MNDLNLFGVYNLSCSNQSDDERQICFCAIDEFDSPEEFDRCVGKYQGHHRVRQSK